MEGDKLGSIVGDIVSEGTNVGLCDTDGARLGSADGRHPSTVTVILATTHSELSSHAKYVHSSTPMKPSGGVYLIVKLSILVHISPVTPMTVRGWPGIGTSFSNTEMSIAVFTQACTLSSTA